MEAGRVVKEEAGHAARVVTSEVGKAARVVTSEARGLVENVAERYVLPQLEARSYKAKLEEGLEGELEGEGEARRRARRRS